LPIGSWPGNATAASRALTIIASCPPARSPSLKLRPLTIGTRIVSKKPGVITRSVLVIRLAGPNSRPSGSSPLLPPPPPMAAYDVTAADDTPRMAPAASFSCRSVSTMRAGCV
jgi:hypothetical protein